MATTRIKSTKKYRELIAAGLDEDTAAQLATRARAAAIEPQPQSAAFTALVAAGYSEADARALLDSSRSVTPDDEDEEDEPPTAKQEADAMVARRGLAHARGCVYINSSILEAGARVMRKGKPEIVATSGVGRTKFVLVMREESGDVSIRNLYRPA